MAGDIAPQGKVDVVVALHACDMATDDALHAAVLGGARAIVAAPCCHKQLRPQLERHRKGSEADPALQAILRHGVLADRHAEAVTDTMRCLALECVGYEARMVEWAPLDHTAKNTMLVATRSSVDTDAEARLRALAAFHGVARQRLCGLLDLDLPGADEAAAAAPRGRMPRE